MKLEDLEIDDYVYPRPQKDQGNVSSLVEKLKAGIHLDPIIVQKVKMPDAKERVITLNGGHRLVAYEEFNKLKGYKRINDTPVDFWKEEIIDYEEYKDEMLIYSYRINDRQGLNMRNMDTKYTARKLRKEHPDWSAEIIGKKLDRVKSSIWEHIKDVIQEQDASEHQLIMRLVRLGWMQEEIGDVIGKTQPNINQIIKKFDSELIYNLFKKGKKIEEIAKLHDIDTQTVWSIVLDGKSDIERFKLFGDSKYGNNQPKILDYWKFDKRDPRVGGGFDGALWCQDVMNILYRFSKQGDLIIDPLAGGGTVIDTCLIMNRKCRAYDIKPTRKDITEWDIREGFPEKAKGCSLIIFDPPYYKKKENEYGCEGITKDRQTFIDFVDAFAKDSIGTVKNGGYVSLVYGQYLDYEDEEKSILGSDLVKIFEDKGFRCILKIQSPLDFNTQWKSYDVEKAKEYNPWQFLPVSRDWHIFKR